jgi:hypothetical protein
MLADEITRVQLPGEERIRIATLEAAAGASQ